MASDKALEALADPTRRDVLERLRRGPQPVNRIAAGLPVSRPAVSQHLKVLEGAGLVRAHREGTRRIYAIEVNGLMELRRYLDRFWDDVLESFRAEAERSSGRGAPARPGRKPPKSRRRKRNG